MKRNSIYFFALVGLIAIVSCRHNTNVNIDIMAKPKQKLSEYKFFVGDLKNLTPNEGVMPYDLITPLFTDYAYKLRFVWMPQGTAANYNREEVFDFPEGAVLIKNFYYPDDFRQPEGKRRILETRLLVKKKTGWEALEYIWNDDQTEALLDQAGDSKQVEWIDKHGQKQQTNYLFPNKNQCKNCHNINDKLMPIGPKARYLNFDHSYSSGKANQLEAWTKVGYLKGCEDKSKIITNAKWDDTTTGDLEFRAKSYLEINCAHCHRKEGSANTSGLYLLLSDKNPESWGIMKSPVAAGKASGNCLYDVVPGKPDESILIYRLDNTDPGIMMPELGRTMVHQEGVELLRLWISEMKPLK